MRYWIKFTKEGLQKYISHRDMLKVMNRTMKRARIPIAFSQGFNPHALISFSTPLELGVASITEFMGVHLTQELETEELARSFQLHLPPGFVIISVMKVPRTAPKLMAWIGFGVYQIKSDAFTAGLLKSFIGDISKQEEITVLKYSKKKLKKINAKPLIKQLDIVNGNELQATLQTGQSGNLKVSQFIEVFEQVSGQKIEEWSATRIKLLGLEQGDLLSPVALIHQNYLKEGSFCQVK